MIRGPREIDALLMVGNFASKWGGSIGASESLAQRLAAHLPVITASGERYRAVRLYSMLRTVLARRHEYRVAQVDVFSGAAFVWAESVCSAFHAIGKQYVLTLHGGNLPRFAQRWPGRVGRLLGRAKAVTAPSPYLVDQLSRFRSDIQYVPNGMEVADYPFAHRKSVSPRLLWLRAFHDIYNPQAAITTMSHLQDLRGATLTMAGPTMDDSLRETVALAKRLGVHERVRFIGPVPKNAVPALLSEHDILLNTPRVDNAPVSVIEALACGLCVVSTNVGGIPYLLKDGETALLVPCGEPRYMAAAVHRLVEDSELAGRLSCFGRALALRHSWDEVLPRWLSLLSAKADHARHDHE